MNTFYKRGFTLIELMVAVTILGVVLTSFVSVATQANRMGHHQRWMAMALNVGERVTEELTMLDDEDVDLELGTHERWLSKEGRDTSESAADFQVIWEVTPWPDVPGSLQIAVEVHWEEAGVAKEIGWTTYRG